MEESHESNDAIDNTVIHTQLTEDEPPSDDVTAESPSKNVPKSIQGLEIGGRLPGAFNIRQRATGERPVWVQQEETENALESCHDSSSTRSETSMAIHEIDESCVVIEVAELSKPLDDPILIEGTTVHSKRSRFFLVSGFFTLVIAVAVSVALVTTKITSSATPVSPGQYHDPIHASLSPTSAPFGMQLDWTIADALLHNRGHLVALLAAGRLLIDILNDTDTNYTYFGMVEEATLLANVDSTILSKFLSPYWNGHVVSTALFNYMTLLILLPNLTLHIAFILTTLAARCSESHDCQRTGFGCRTHSRQYGCHIYGWISHDIATEPFSEKQYYYIIHRTKPYLQKWSHPLCK